MQQQANYLQQLLVSLRTRLLVMCASVGIALEDAGKAMAAGDPGRAASVIENDAAIDALENEIDEMALRLLARSQPVAGDLRFVVTSLRMVVDLERMGDEAHKMARMVKSIIESGAARSLPSSDLRMAADLASGLLRKALDAFARLDTKAALDILKEDDLIDKEFDGFVRKLVTYMMEDPRTISASLDLLFLAKAIERIGDHSKNVAELIIYLVKGKDVRHAAMNDIESAVLQ